MNRQCRRMTALGRATWPGGSHAVVPFKVSAASSNASHGGDAMSEVLYVLGWVLDSAIVQGAIQFARSNAFIFTIVGVIATWLINRDVGRRNKAKLLQEQQTASDRHILSLCKALSDHKQSLQFAAAALLLDRARSTGADGRPGSERAAVIQALLAATIDDTRTTEKSSASAELCKLIADSIVEIQGARSANADAGSPLKKFYWQQVRLINADWKDVDARNLDLFGANFDRASLRRANLKDAILKNASLRNATLSGADLRNVDLSGTDLNGADLTACTRTGKVIPTQMSGAKLHAADLTEAKLEGVDLSHVKFDSHTKWPAGFQPGQSSAQASRVDPAAAGAPA